MIYLLDTHIFLWSLFEPEKLSDPITEILNNEKNKLMVSQISFWEISVKYATGKLSFDNIVPEDLEEQAEEMGFDILPLNNSDLLSFYHLPKVSHKDPFDRLLIWQAIKHNFILLSHDGKMNLYQDYGLRLLG